MQIIEKCSVLMTKTYGSFTLIRVISASIRETGWATEIHSVSWSTQHAHYRRVSLTFIEREWKTHSNRANVESCSFSPDNNVFNRWAFYNIGALNPEYTLNLPHRLISPPSLPRSWRSPPTTVLRWSANKPPEMERRLLRTNCAFYSSSFFNIWRCKYDVKVKSTVLFLKDVL